jgi:hypothetical protein
VKVRDIMSSPVFEVTPNTSVARVIDLMVGERISGLPTLCERWARCLQAQTFQKRRTGTKTAQGRRS